MSSGGKFLLVINRGVQDQLLNADDLLKQRLIEFISNKDKRYSHSELASLPINDYLKIEDSILPNINFIEQTHVVLTAGHFKPYVPTTMEYIKVNPISKPIDFGRTIVFQPTQVGNFMNDMVLHLKIDGLRAQNYKDRVRYVAFPGHKIIKKIQFVANNTVIDELTTDDYTDHYLYGLNTIEKKKNWCKNVGQELPKQGYLTSDPIYDMYREYRWIGDGFQTYKYSHDSLELFIPLLFWFKELKSSIPSHILPWGKLEVRVFLAEVSEIVAHVDYGGGGKYIPPVISLCELYINNIFTIEEIYNIYKKKFVFSLIRVHQHQTQIINTNLSNDSPILLRNLKFPLENLFIMLRPQENTNMSQHWYKSSKLIEKTSKVPVIAVNTNNIITGTISATKPENPSISAILVASGLSAVDDTYVEYDFIITSGSGFSNDLSQNRYTITSYIGSTKQITIDGIFNGRLDSTTTFDLFLPQLAINKIIYYDEVPTIDSISLKSHNEVIWAHNSEKFYNAYLPSRFGGIMGMPEDNGTYFIPFNFCPFTYQPTGSYNSSVARELYLYLKSSVISKDYPAELIINARAINFLCVKDGIMSLQYVI